MKEEYKEIGMIFNTEMVRAILSGQKTQTRRLLKWQPCGRGFTYNTLRHPKTFMACHADVHSPLCAGDRIYVRETWCRLPKFNERTETPIEGTEQYYYRADGENPTPYTCFTDKDGELDLDKEKVFPTWKPSIHMPKEAARIWLAIKKVRCERVNNISYKDAIAEGCSSINNFLDLWYSIYGIDTKKDNFYVWVYEFERIEK